jgi:predicted metal-binding membrane protein
MTLVRLFRQANRANRGTPLATVAFLAGYLVVWTTFAVVALVGDAAIHRAVSALPSLAARPWLIGGTMLIGAGGFQFSALKERCLAQCRSPFTFFVRRYRRGMSGAWKLGFGHGQFCLGCCWAFMLLMLGLGVDSIAWMVNLAVVSFVERATESGPRFSSIFGAILIIWGFMMLLQPAGIPQIVVSP